MEYSSYPRIGLKLWSINTDTYLNAAVQLHQQGIFDYLELYVVPDTLHTLDLWRNTNIPYQIHAPHFAHGVNLARPEKLADNQRFYEQVATFFRELDAEYTVVHLGIEGDIEEAIRQLGIINPPSVLIENKPYLAPFGEGLCCRGATLPEIEQVMLGTGCGLCLDIGHALCTANFLRQDPYETLAAFQQLSPQCYHVSDNFIDSHIDRHLNFGQGNYDFLKIFSLLTSIRNLTIETNKNSKDDLQDFVGDVQFLKGLFE